MRGGWGEEGGQREKSEDKHRKFEKQQSRVANKNERPVFCHCLSQNIVISTLKKIEKGDEWKK